MAAVNSEPAHRLEVALRGVPRVAYAGAHVYPAAAPVFTSAPLAPRPHPDHPFLRLYVHLPFCRYRCSFCHYAVKVTDERERMERYVSALLRELEWVLPGTPLSQLFVGGGTPTALPADLLSRVLGAIFERMPRHGAEVHIVEASPETFSDEHGEVLVRHGIGRVSMGVQSLSEPVLDAVRRGHGARTALDAVAAILAHGLILNVDLMYGLPGQTHASFRSDVARLAQAGAHSFTFYDLRLSSTTPVAGRLRADEWLSLGRLVEWRALVKAVAEEHGYTQTRWHTFTRLDGPAARHRRAPCNTEAGIGFQLGIGMSARAHLGDTVYRNHRGFDEYVRRIEAGESPVEDIFALGERDRRTQHIARSIGDGRPLDREAYRAAFGTTIEADFPSLVERLLAAGAIEERGGALHLTEAGKLVHDLVTLAFYPEPAQAWLRSREHPTLAIAPATAAASGAG